ncbi:MAG: large subunit ribosomal protein L27 [Parcubacteria group bacterium Gr01-1014_107]|nr:MAG: large subunit ribosomal protein L27 [Parcubacteria group bacterium Gr01-1014_107]
MAHKKSTGSTKNNRDSNPRYLGVKVNDGEKAGVGAILIRQKGTEFLAGKNVGRGKDYTLFALKDGVVKINRRRIIHFNSTTEKKKVVSVL